MLDVVINHLTTATQEAQGLQSNPEDIDTDMGKETVTVRILFSRSLQQVITSARSGEDQMFQWTFSTLRTGTDLYP